MRAIGWGLGLGLVLGVSGVAFALTVHQAPATTEEAKVVQQQTKAQLGQYLEAATASGRYALYGEHPTLNLVFADLLAQTDVRLRVLEDHLAQSVARSKTVIRPWRLIHFFCLAGLLALFGMAVGYGASHPTILPYWRRWLMLLWVSSIVALWVEFYKPDIETIMAVKRYEPQLRIQLSEEVANSLSTSLQSLDARLDALEATR